MTIFGNIVSGDELEAAIQSTLETWIDVYMAEFELSRGLAKETLPRPRAWVVSDTIDREGTDQLPTIIIINAGLSGDKPLQEGDGTYRAFWTVGVGIFVSAATRADTMRLVRQYAAIIRMIMLQKQSFGGFADGSVWLDESYDDNFQFTDDQTISAGQVIFEIEVSNTATRFGGPVTPPDVATQPGSDWPTADTVDVDIVKEEI